MPNSIAHSDSLDKSSSETLVGNTAPNFQIEGTSGTVILNELNQGVVLYFYPKDNTPGCTTESQQFAEYYPQFLAQGFQVFGCSRDSLKSHLGFKNKLALPFDLLSDSQEILCQLFGVIKDKKMYGKTVRGIERSTFVINANKKVVHEWRGVKVPGHVEAVLNALRK